MLPFGSVAAVKQKYAGIARAAAADGLCFDPEGQLAGNSEDAHRLLLWANDKMQAHRGDHFEALLEEMFLIYNCARTAFGLSSVALHYYCRRSWSLNLLLAVIRMHLL